MDVKNLLKNGELLKARELLIQEVKRSPSDIFKRMLLFEVLSFCGEWEKAKKHLDILEVQNVDIELHKDLINSEIERYNVFNCNTTPAFLPEELPAYAIQLQNLLELLKDKNINEAKLIIKKIDTEHNTVQASVNNKEITTFKNSDTLLSRFLEVFVYGNYILIPFESIEELNISKPKSFIDLLWISAEIRLTNKMLINAYLPVLYPFSYKNERDMIKLGRETQWTQDDNFYKGMGQHVFEIDDDQIAILEINKAVFKTESY